MGRTLALAGLLVAGCAQGTDAEPGYTGTPPTSIGDRDDTEDDEGDDAADAGDPNGGSTGGWTSADDTMPGTGGLPPMTSGGSGGESGGPGDTSGPPGGSTGFGESGFGESGFGSSGFGDGSGGPGPCGGGFPCGDGTCIPPEWVCDFFPDCDNGSDEHPLLCF